MNLLRRIAVFVHSHALELLLALAVVLLIAQLCWPDFYDWWNRPTPGNVGFDQFEATTLADHFAIYLPQSYRNKPTWPLVVFLHGSGERGSDPKMLRDSWPFASTVPAIVVAPQCLPSYVWQPDAVAEFIQHVASHYHADPDRIYLVGFSMGAYGVWQSAAANPELFAAIVSISGGGEMNHAERLTDIPVWAFHGANDDVVPVDSSKRMIEAIQNAGGQPRLTIIPDAGHGICRSICNRADFWEWLLRQTRSR